MPRFPRRALAAIFSTAVGLAFLVSFKTPEAPPLTPTTGTTGGTQTGDGSSGSGAGSTSGNGTGNGSGSSSGSGSGSGSGSTGALRDGTVTGQPVDMRFGTVEVQVTISGGKITEVSALELPSGGRSGRISQIVEPMLRSEALSAQSSSIDIVSGATYTSEAYAQSLQSALDQAHG